MPLTHAGSIREDYPDLATGVLRVPAPIVDVASAAEVNRLATSLVAETKTAEVWPSATVEKGRIP